MISIINYELGNVISVQNALNKLGYKNAITRDENIISNSSHLILPGVGAFKKGIDNLKKFGLDRILSHEVLVRQKQILGICLGFQLMCKSSEEFGFFNGLGWLDLEVKRINNNQLRLPHVGWNKIDILNKNNLLFKNITENDLLYFNHSYCVVNKGKENQKIEDLVECNYGSKFLAAMRFKNIYGIQPHPEKSQKQGLQILKNFIEN